MLSITFCVWDLQRENYKLLDKVEGKLKSILEQEFILGITDLKQLEISTNTDICIGFGDIAFNSIPDELESWRVPDINLVFSNNDTYREQLVETFKEIKESLLKQEEEDRKVIQIEKNNITVGKNADINITPQEVEYIKNIKEILGGGTIVFKKGDIELRIEDDNNRKDTREDS